MKFSIREKRVMDVFISSAKELIDDYGLDNITIRKIAEISGYNSATLYNYFQNLDELLIYASVDYLNEYMVELKEKTKDIKDPVLRYIKVYEVFNKYAFSKPDVYFNIFYGVYSKNLPSILANYYEIYPEALDGFDDLDVLNMLKTGAIINRDYEVTKVFCEKYHLSSKQLNFLIHTVIRVHSSYLYDVVMNKNIDTDAHCTQFLDFLKNLLNLVIKE
ncbi:TetR/AcrR family transcriptional regulator [Peptoniphilus equinus]|uniref:TetR/AcrR family transcriptional regulator n=1 Tax=Peptoniphilus equinus TaxID=3016343 RepID=A0ABY7QVA7_9FIRM|nr:TetR/AcrR family transcriptional regulator [Peptoniphilus equinus]WBW50123.1 TetR/AcrR family transcriptional regulator [Peptoniphilus equinus]